MKNLSCPISEATLCEAITLSLCCALSRLPSLIVLPFVSRLFCLVYSVIHGLARLDIPFMRFLLTVSKELVSFRLLKTTK